MKPATKNLALGALVVVLFAAAGLLFYVRGGSAQPKYPSGYEIHGVDLATKEELTVKASNDEVPPLENPKTGQRTVYPWYFCADCKLRLVPELVPARRGGPPKLPMIVTCPKCGATCSRWRPDDPAQGPPAGDLPLPALPK